MNNKIYLLEVVSGVNKDYETHVWRVNKKKTKVAAVIASPAIVSVCIHVPDHTIYLQGIYYYIIPSPNRESMLDKDVFYVLFD